MGDVAHPKILSLLHSSSNKRRQRQHCPWLQHQVADPAKMAGHAKPVTSTTSVSRTDTQPGGEGAQGRGPASAPRHNGVTPQESQALAEAQASQCLHACWEGSFVRQRGSAAQVHQQNREGSEHGKVGAGQYDVPDCFL